jgi:hypothetical protein
MDNVQKPKKLRFMDLFSSFSPEKHFIEFPITAVRLQAIMMSL